MGNVGYPDGGLCRAERSPDRPDSLERRPELARGGPISYFDPHRGFLGAARWADFLRPDFLTDGLGVLKMINLDVMDSDEWLQRHQIKCTHSNGDSIARPEMDKSNA